MSAKIYAEYLDHMGSDLTVVNAARASFGKESDWQLVPAPPYGLHDKQLKPEDANLIRFLATGFRSNEWEDFLDKIITLGYEIAIKDETKRDELTTLLHEYKRKAQHWAPFAHPQVQIRMSLPIFLARQFVKHQVGGVWSEESRRYISGDPEVWYPDTWHTRPQDIKQGSGGPISKQSEATWNAENAVSTCIDSYRSSLSIGVAPEEARITLPLNMMTTVVWTGSLAFWARVCNQRVDSHAQLPAQELGKIIASIIEPLFPVSWKHLTT